LQIPPISIIRFYCGLTALCNFFIILMLIYFKIQSFYIFLSPIKLFFQLYYTFFHFLNLSKIPEKNYLDEAKQPFPVPLEFLLFKFIFTSTPRGYESLTFDKQDLTREFIALYTF
jgi:hypothetical protein